MRIKLICCVMVWLSPCHLVTLSPCHAFDDVIDSPMYGDPKVPIQHVVIKYVGARDLWLEALERPEADLRCKAADAIALAHQHGVEGMEKTIGPLLAELDRPDQHPTVCLAVARALIVLNARKCAASLFREAQSGNSELRGLVEPALARWDHRPARAVWLERLRHPKTFRPDLVRAIRALARVREQKAIEPIRELVLSAWMPGPVRLEAAAALAQFRTRGLEKDAARLAADMSAGGLFGRLAAVRLLERHEGTEAVRLLQGLARGAEPAVAVAAVGRLMAIDPPLVLPMVDGLLASPDPQLRTFAVAVMPLQPVAQNVSRLVTRLNDPHPDVRRKARGSLERVAAKADLRAQVIKETRDVLARQQWQGLEQAAILLTHLDHKPAAGRLVELLNSDRPEVFVTAAWALRKLAVREKLPRVRDYIHVTQKEVRSGNGGRARYLTELDHQLSQLNQLLGHQKYRPADDALRQFIPMMPMRRGIESRAAAIWALGKIHEDQRVYGDGPGGLAATRWLIVLVEGRLNDYPPPPPPGPPEALRIRRMAAVALGWIKARQTLTSLRTHWRKAFSTDQFNNACGWAIEHITGERMPAPIAGVHKVPIGFLVKNP
jgi:hypothetical protein